MIERYYVTEWHCPRCSSLLGLVVDNGLVILHIKGRYWVNQSEMGAVCPRCGEICNYRYTTTIFL